MILKDAEENYEIILEDEKAAVQHGSEETHYTVIESSDIILFFMIIPLFLINYSLYYSINRGFVKFLRVFFSS